MIDDGYQERVLEVGGNHVYVREFRPASSPTMMLVHGAGVSGRYLVPTARALGGRVLIPDLPGFGRSSKPRRLLTLPELGEALAGAMQSLGLEDAIFLGHSFGCQVLLELAVQRPDMVRGLILVGPTFDSFARTYPKQAARFVRTMVREPPAFFSVAIRDYAACRVWRALGVIAMGMKDKPEGKLASVQAPSLVIRGQEDRISPGRWVEFVSRTLPRGRLLVIPGAAHAVNFSHPSQLAQAVTAFASGRS